MPKSRISSKDIDKTMCGLAGFLQLYPDAKVHDLGSTLAAMGNALKHRGPDSSGIWMDQEQGIGIAHRRLSIQDLSEAGNQPMHSRSQRYVIAFNGEIYNHLDLRRELDDGGRCEWRGHSDTETLLSGFDGWGVEKTIRKAVGMFAIALWDREEAALYLIRDRIGEKPLYYGRQKGTLLFGSELKALKIHPAFEGRINRNAVVKLLRNNYIPSPDSIFQGIGTLPPGSYVKVAARSADREPEVKRYWSLAEIASEGSNHPETQDEDAALLELERVLSKAVSLQMLADVPVGAFLSGGIDSSTIVALMQAQSSRPVKTFTIGFNEVEFDEAQHARAVARHLGTDHTELYVTPKDALNVIPALPKIYDEPFSDSSQIPTVLIAQLARNAVTVSLSGDGGDELFGGYNRYVWARRIWGWIRTCPRPIRSWAAQHITAISPSIWNERFRALGRFTPAALSFGNPGDRLHKLAGVVVCESPAEMYQALTSHWQAPAELVIGAQEPATSLEIPTGLPNLEAMMMYLDSIAYLPGDILVKLDRAAMAVSLETRLPFLDHRVIECSWRLPISMKIKNGEGKRILRRILYKYVPRPLVQRPKMGFGVPIDSWLRGPLRAWAEELIGERRLRQEGILNADLVSKRWAEHIRGDRNWQYQMWDVLMFQAWLEAQ